MIVLLDLEWIEKDERWLTQLSAIRTDENWNPVSRLDIFVKPDDACFNDPQHVAFGGKSPELYRNAVSEKDAILDFSEWLEYGDTVWVWAKSNKTYFCDLWNMYMDYVRPVVKETANKVRAVALRNGITLQSPYALLAGCGDTPPFPEHLAQNDTEVMRRLYQCLGITPQLMKEAPAPLMNKPEEHKPTQREKNQKLIDHTQYNYLFLKDSRVFHRRECKICLNAKSESGILGSVYYRTASSSGRRPCKICKPVPNLFTAPISDAELSRTERVKAGQLYHLNREIIKVKMLTGEVIDIRRGKIVGWCHHNLHRGAVNKEILKKHDCLGKNCPYLHKNAQSPYWKTLEIEKKKKEQRKAELKAEKVRRALEANDMLALASSWQSYLDDMESDMHIVRVTKEAPTVRKIYYVSDNRFADGNRYPEFLETLTFLHPNWRIVLRHIRDVDGHFVTRDEYNSRARK